MSLEKSITHGKEYRKPYRGAKAIDQWEVENDKNNISLAIRPIIKIQ